LAAQRGEPVEQHKMRSMPDKRAISNDAGRCKSVFFG